MQQKHQCFARSFINEKNIETKTLYFLQNNVKMSTKLVKKEDFDSNFIYFNDAINAYWRAADKGYFSGYFVNFAYFADYRNVGAARLAPIWPKEGYFHFCVRS